MKWFLAIFFSVYSLMHLYVFLRLIKPNFSTQKNIAFFVLFCLMVLSPILWRALEAKENGTLTYWVAFLSLLWMGFILYVVFFSLAVDTYRGLVFLSKHLFGVNPIPTPSSRLSMYLVLFLSLCVSVYSYYETLHLQVVKVKIETDKIPVKKLRILHISDLHLGPVMREDKINLIREVWEREKPDLIVSTGDLVDGSMEGKDNLAHLLASMSAPLGKFAVLGNHEYYRGFEQAVEFTQKAGFILLRGEVRDLGPILVVGVDDDDCRFFNACRGETNEYKLLKSTQRSKFVLLLKHKPKIDPASVGLFDLMLSGHTHGGVYRPIGQLILKRLFLTDRGLLRLGNSYIFVSKGVGTGGPPMRLFSPPDVALIDLVKK
jgi:predicted MPP superfamily phosphohydrolase